MLLGKQLKALRSMTKHVENEKFQFVPRLLWIFDENLRFSFLTELETTFNRSGSDLRLSFVTRCSYMISEMNGW